MKTLSIYKREVLVRTGFKKFPFKKETQISIFYNGICKANHYEDIKNRRLKVVFENIIQTRSYKRVNEYIKTLPNTNDGKWEKETLKMLLNIK